MARMIPAVLPDDLPSPAEPLVFEALRDAPGTEDWTVLHSLDIARHVSRPFGEADLVAIVPGWGIVVLEVKGIRSIARAPDGGWLLGANASPDARGPFRQARDAMFSIRREIEQRAPRVRMLTASMVVMPYIPLELTSIEWEEWEVADSPTITRYGWPGVVRRAMNGLEASLGRPPDDRTMTDEMVDEIIRVLRPSFEVNISPRERLADLEARTRRYTEEQFDALDAMGSNRRVLFDGAAGTGKTVLAVESARRASVAGDRTLLLCFNHLLGDHLRAEVATLNGVEAATIHSHMLRTSGLVPPSEGTSDTREFWDVTLPEAATTAVLERGPSVDLIVLDEAQDVLPDPTLRTYLDALLDGELSRGRWHAFGDFTNQAIFSDGRRIPDELSEVPRYSLVHNCRNARPIADVAAAIGRLDLGYRSVLRDDDGPAVWVDAYEDDDALVAATFAAVAGLREIGHDAGDIVVLLPRAESPLATALGLDAPRAARASGGGIRSHTIQAFKGLEAPAVVVAGVEDVASEYWRSVLYVGITRARHAVRLVVHNDVREDVERIMKEGPR